MKIKMTKNDMSIEIDMSIEELVVVMNTLDIDITETETPNQKVYTGKQYDVSHLDNWNLADIYRGVNVYDVGIRGYGICIGDFIDRKTFNTIGIVHKYIDNEIDNVGV